MSEFDVVIKDGMIVDGARSPRYVGDVAIRDGLIARLGRTAASRAARVIDARGLVVAPGFIDLHTHYDAQVFWDPYLSTSGFQGVTSVVIGNCGFGFAPMAPESRQRAMQSMTRVEAIPFKTLQAALPWDWVSYPEYLDSIERAPKAVNILPYVPVNPLLIWTMGFAAAKSGRMPTDAEHAQIARLLHEAMDAGACGFSAQCLGTAGRPDLPTLGGTAQIDFDGTPMPSDVMWPETRAVLAKVLGDRGEGFIALSMGLSNPDEWEKLAAISNAPLLWQALPAGGDERGTKMRRHLLRWLAGCQQRGLRIYAQGITQDPALVFTFDYFDLWGEVWGEYVGPTLSTAERVANLRDSSVREKLRAAPLKYPFIASIPDTVLKRTETARFKPFADQRIGQIAEALGMHPVDVVCEMVAADGLRSVFETRQFDTTLEGLRELIDAPYVIPGLSDGGAHLKYLTAGSFGTEYISKYVREHGFTTLEEAHWRLSALPAFCAGFRDRGVLREGAAADIIVYDFDRLDTTYPEFVRDLPGDEYRVMNRGHGYRHVLVNGGVTIEDDAPTHCHSGALLRRGELRARDGRAGERAVSVSVP